MDYSWPVDISDDGRQLLFSEQGVAGGPGYAAYIRGTDGSPAVRLGKGDAHSLSHDGRWAIATDLSTHTLMLLPTGTGQPRAIPSHGITAYSWAGFFPGDKRIVFAGTAKDGGGRSYVQDLDGGAPRPITPNGVAPVRNTVSPDGKWLAANYQGCGAAVPSGRRRAQSRARALNGRMLRSDGTRTERRSMFEAAGCRRASLRSTSRQENER